MDDISVFFIFIQIDHLYFKLETINRVLLVIKRYILKLVELAKLIPFKLILLEPSMATILINHQMAIIQVYIGKNFIDGVFFNSGFGININTKKL